MPGCQKLNTFGLLISSLIICVNGYGWGVPVVGSICTLGLIGISWRCASAPTKTLIITLLAAKEGSKILKFMSDLAEYDNYIESIIKSYSK